MRIWPPVLVMATMAGGSGLGGLARLIEVVSLMPLMMKAGWQSMLVGVPAASRKMRPSVLSLCGTARAFSLLSNATSWLFLSMFV